MKSAKWVFSDFCNFRLLRIFQQQIAPQSLEIDQNNQHTEFLAQNVDFNLQSFHRLHSSPPYGGLKFWYSFKTHYYFHACCTLNPQVVAVMLLCVMRVLLQLLDTL